MYELGLMVGGNKQKAYQERSMIEENRYLIMKVGVIGGIIFSRVLLLLLGNKDVIFLIWMKNE